jgi:hypothetical protein
MLATRTSTLTKVLNFGNHFFRTLHFGYTRMRGGNRQIPRTTDDVAMPAPTPLLSLAFQRAGKLAISAFEMRLL